MSALTLHVASPGFRPARTVTISSGIGVDVASLARPLYRDYRKLLGVPRMSARMATIGTLSTLPDMTVTPQAVPA